MWRNAAFTKRGFARGHLAPYAIMGGDRDKDGKLAEKDDDDSLTVFQSNYLSNIAPQHHHGFNVEKQKKEVWILAGCVFGPGDPEKVGKEKDIWVPPMFYKIVVMDNPDTDIPIVKLRAGLRIKIPSRLGRG